jgi:hypothetical protein
MSDPLTAKQGARQMLRNRLRPAWMESAIKALSIAWFPSKFLTKVSYSQMIFKNMVAHQAIEWKLSVVPGHNPRFDLGLKGPSERPLHPFVGAQEDHLWVIFWLGDSQ